MIWLHNWKIVKKKKLNRDVEILHIHSLYIMQVYRMDTLIKVSDYLWWNETTKRLYIYVLLPIVLSQKICRYQKKNLLEKRYFVAD